MESLNAADKMPLGIVTFLRVTLWNQKHNNLCLSDHMKMNHVKAHKNSGHFVKIPLNFSWVVRIIPGEKQALNPTTHSKAKM